MAKAFFQFQDYPKCLEILGSIDAAHSTMVLFERQSLCFRAIYLDSRQKAVTVNLIAQLQEVIEVFNQCQAKTPGPPINSHHEQRFAEFTSLLELMNKYQKQEVHIDSKLLSEESDLESKRYKFEGFPCYLLSSQWMDDFQKALRYGKGFFVGPLTNYAILNDLF